MAREWNTIWKGSLRELDQTRLIALKAPHSSDWLFAFQLPLVVSVYPMKSVYVSVSIFVNLTLVHVVPTFAREVHTVFHVKKVAAGQHGYHQVNDLIRRSL